MKHKTILISLLALTAMLGLVIGGLALCNQPQKTGQFTQNPDAYLMEFQVLQGKYSHTLYLQQGDVLAVELERIRGSFDVEIALKTMVSDDIEVLNLLYTGNDVTGGDFELPIDQTGTYKITVIGRHAEGVANFYVKGGHTAP